MEKEKPSLSLKPEKILLNLFCWSKALARVEGLINHVFFLRKTALSLQPRFIHTRGLVFVARSYDLMVVELVLFIYNLTGE